MFIIGIDKQQNTKKSGIIVNSIFLSNIHKHIIHYSLRTVKSLKVGILNIDIQFMYHFS